MAVQPFSGFFIQKIVQACGLLYCIVQKNLWKHQKNLLLLTYYLFFCGPYLFEGYYRLFLSKWFSTIQAPKFFQGLLQFIPAHTAVWPAGGPAATCELLRSHHRSLEHIRVPTAGPALVEAGLFVGPESILLGPASKKAIQPTFQK